MFLKPAADLRDTNFPDPVPYHPLPNVIRTVSDFMPVATVVFAGWIDIGESFVFAAEFFRLYLFAIYNLVMPDFLRCSFCYVCPQQLKLTLSLLLPFLMLTNNNSEIQTRRTSILQNISTVSIFFSGVSATTLQYNGQLQSQGFATSSDFLWLLSLLLSTACAIQCQLAIYWHTSRHRRSPKDTPWLVTLATYEIPLALLGASSVAFLIGLAFFYLQGLHRSQFPGDWNNSGDMFSWLCSAWFYPLAGA